MPLLPGFELAALRSQVRRSYQQAILAPVFNYHNTGTTAPLPLPPSTHTETTTATAQTSPFFFPPPNLIDNN